MAKAQTCKRLRSARCQKILKKIPEGKFLYEKAYGLKIRELLKITKVGNLARLEASRVYDLKGFEGYQRQDAARAESSEKLRSAEEESSQRQTISIVLETESLWNLFDFIIRNLTEGSRVVRCCHSLLHNTRSPVVYVSECYNFITLLCPSPEAIESVVS
ncbi:hypothetical protein J6590_000872 [Homalodisca vitripennis]|nr:hypothetical protein J6590_000872 [Homalodisca vitripennis]